MSYWISDIYISIMDIYILNNRYLYQFHDFYSIKGEFVGLCFIAINSCSFSDIHCLFCLCHCIDCLTTLFLFFEFLFLPKTFLVIGHLEPYRICIYKCWWVYYTWHHYKQSSSKAEVFPSLRRSCFHVLSKWLAMNLFCPDIRFKTILLLLESHIVMVS